MTIEFDIDGMRISEPTMDSTGRYHVLPSEEYIAQEGEMVPVYLNGTEILLNFDGFNELMALLDETSPVYGEK